MFHDIPELFIETNSKQHPDQPEVNLYTFALGFMIGLISMVILSCYIPREAAGPETVSKTYYEIQFENPETEPKTFDADKVEYFLTQGILRIELSDQELYYPLDKVKRFRVYKKQELVKPGD